MRIVRLIALLALAAPLPARAIDPNEKWQDGFDRYPTGSRIAGQGGWQTWGGGPAFNTVVTDARSLSPPNALLLAGSTDVLQRFSDVAGSWDLYVRVYIPKDQTGEVWIRLANTYTGGDSANFSVRLAMCVTACTTSGAVPGFAVNMGGSEVPASGSAPLVTDQWTDVHVIINSTPRSGYQYTLLYNGQSLGTFPWGVTAPSTLAAIDYRSNNSSAVYMDNMELLEYDPLPLMDFAVE